MAITGAIRGNSKETLYQDLGFKSLQSLRWFRKLSLLQNNKKRITIISLYLIPKPLTLYSTRNSENLPPIKANHRFFKNTFFQSTIIEWNKLDSNIRCSPSYKLSRKRTLEFTRPQSNSIFNVPNSSGLTYLMRLRVGLINLREHKFCHNFRNSLKPICNCGNSIESTKNFKNERQSLLPNVRIVNPNLLSMNKDALTYLLLYGDNTFGKQKYFSFKLCY